MKYQWLNFVGLLIFTAFRFLFTITTGRVSNLQEDLILLTITFCVVLFGVFVYCAIFPPRPAPPSSSNSQLRRPAPSPAPARPAPPPLNDTERELLHRLVGLLYGDWDTATRLLLKTFDDHPTRSHQWILEKTIDDLIRDRSR